MNNYNNNDVNEFTQRVFNIIKDKPKDYDYKFYNNILRDLNRYNDIIDELDIKNDKLNDKLNRKIIKYKKEIELLNDKIIQLKNDRDKIINIAKQNKENMTKYFNKLSDENEKLRIRILDDNKYTNDITKLNIKINDLIKENNYLLQSDTCNIIKINELKKENERLTNELNILKNNNNNFNDKIDFTQHLGDINDITRDDSDISDDDTDVDTDDEKNKNDMREDIRKEILNMNNEKYNDDYELFNIKKRYNKKLEDFMNNVNKNKNNNIVLQDNNNPPDKDITLSPPIGPVDYNTDYLVYLLHNSEKLKPKEERVYYKNKNIFIKHNDDNDKEKDTKNIIINENINNLQNNDNKNDNIMIGGKHKKGDRYTLHEVEGLIKMMINDEYTTLTEQDINRDDKKVIQKIYNRKNVRRYRRNKIN